jgi:uncharacterized protein YdbL (DUF1318 family)
MAKESAILRSIFGYALLALSLAACVTINIYFPAAAAEEAARTIVRDVLGDEAKPSEEQESSPDPKADDNQSLFDTTSSTNQTVTTQTLRPTYGLVSKLSDTVSAVFDFLVPVAHAEQPNIDISSPSIRKLRASMSKRQAKMVDYYRSGALGFTKNGLVTVRELKKIPLRDRSRVKKMVADEKGDRKALYAEIARANGHPEWEQSIRDIFARVWIEEAPKAYWYQNSDGDWNKK